MPNNPLFYPIYEQLQGPSIQDRIQIALAIADADLLKTLLTNCVPPISSSHLIGGITATVGFPTPHQEVADGVIQFEAIKCILATDTEEAKQTVPDRPRGGDRSKPKYQPKWESAVITLEPRMTLAQSMVMLADLGFSAKQVEEILYLPSEAGRRTQWLMLDEASQLTIPFVRLIRTVRYTDGTFTFQYKDFFDDEQPCCFKSQPQQVLIAIRSDQDNFAQTLKNINLHRAALNIARVILICNTISDFEAQGFINQGISVYPAVDLMLPTRANCVLCARRECPMNGMENSPIAMCYGFLLDASFM